MRVKDFMKKEVVTVDVNTPIMSALETMKLNKIKRLPVTKNGKFVGLVTRAIIRDASPSSATSLSVYELNYLISKMKVGDIMLKNPITITPDHPVEEAIRLGVEHSVGAFPILEKGNLVGIISESDIAWVVSRALGLGESDSKRLTVEVSGKQFGNLNKLVETMDSHKIPIMSLMSVPEQKGKKWSLMLRVRAKDINILVKDLKKKGFQITDIT